MYIGGGLLLVILIIVIVVFLIRLIGDEDHASSGPDSRRT
jgi:hypothetical protein